MHHLDIGGWQEMPGSPSSSVQEVNFSVRQRLDGLWAILGTKSIDSFSESDEQDMMWILEKLSSDKNLCQLMHQEIRSVNHFFDGILNDRHLSVLEHFVVYFQFLHYQSTQKVSPLQEECRDFLQSLWMSYKDAKEKAIPTAETQN